MKGNLFKIILLRISVQLIILKHKIEFNFIKLVIILGSSAISESLTKNIW